MGSTQWKMCFSNFQRKPKGALDSEDSEGYGLVTCMENEQKLEQDERR